MPEEILKYPEFRASESMSIIMSIYSELKVPTNTLPLLSSGGAIYILSP